MNSYAHWKRSKPTRSLGGGYKPLHDVENVKKPVERKETARKRAAQQCRKRQEELRYTKEDEARLARNRERALSERKVDEAFNIKVALQTKDGIALPNQEFKAFFEDGSEQVFETDDNGVSTEFAEMTRVQKVVISLNHGWIKRDV
ncbi:hypothetical protein THF5G08_310006 [Vibrio jasicida]|uniref:hypothetical protein n=1 Tax=Vibrio jasicida TaxID=766224 RepID=UPI002893DD12|nr:hypothetical protein THF5G08_310006 [Vibrio jasicida]